MENEPNELRSAVLQAEPILPVSDVYETVLYWHSVLGFPDKWTWGDPVNHGGVSWNGAQIQFSLQPQLASVSKGNSIFIKVKNLQSLYDFHRKNNADIVQHLENKPWGMAGYTVKDLNGYLIFFAGAPISQRNKSEKHFPKIKIIERKPTAQEYLKLLVAVGWTSSAADDMIDKILAAPLFSVVAEDTSAHNVVGCAFLIGDNARFFYVKDVMVHPNWQNKRVGSAMMQRISDWLERNAPDRSFIVLVTPENLAPFYRQFGFTPAFSMVRVLQR